MMAELSMAVGFMTWWASVCRIGMMHYKTHKLDVILGHWVTGGAGLIVCGAAATSSADPWLLAMAISFLIPLIYSLPEWKDGAPDWALKAA